MGSSNSGSEEARVEQLARVGKAFGHPIRVRILSVAMAGTRISPLELAERLGQPLGNVSYHVRALAQAGFIEMEGTAFRRGAVQHFYVATSSGRAAWKAITSLSPPGKGGKGAGKAA